jgi:hypothetical protein
LAAMTLPVLFSLIFAAMITLSRSAFGIDQANASRYVSHSLMLGLSLILALAYQLDSENIPSRSLAVGGFAVLVTALFSFPQRFIDGGISFENAWKEARQVAEKRRSNFACHAYQYALEKHGISFSKPCADLFKNQHDLISNYLDDRITSNRPLGWQEKIVHSPVQLNRSLPKRMIPKHNIDSITTDSASLTITGWAFTKASSSKNSEPLFLIAYHGSQPFFASTADQPRPDVQKRWDLPQNRVGFEISIPLIFQNKPLSSIQLATSKNSWPLWENQRVKE